MRSDGDKLRLGIVEFAELVVGHRQTVRHDLQFLLAFLGPLEGSDQEYARRDDQEEGYGREEKTGLRFDIEELRADQENQGDDQCLCPEKLDIESLVADDQIGKKSHENRHTKESVDHDIEIPEDRSHITRHEEREEEQLDAQGEIRDLAPRLAVGLAVAHDRQRRDPHDHQKTEQIVVVDEPLVLDRLAGEIVKNIEIKHRGSEQYGRNDRRKDS